MSDENDDWWMNHLDAMTDTDCPNAPHEHCYWCAAEAAKGFEARIAELEDEIKRYEAGYQWWLDKCQGLENELAEYKAIWEACPACNSTMKPGPHSWESTE